METYLCKTTIYGGRNSRFGFVAVFRAENEVGNDENISIGYKGEMGYSTKPYLTLMRSSFPNIGSAAMRMKITVAAAWIRSIGSPDT